jgi:hypothetical protein
MDQLLQARTQLSAAQRARAAELAEGSPGVALSVDVEKGHELRKQALRLLGLAAEGKFSMLFALTNQLTKQQAVPFDSLMESMYSLLTDLLELANRPGAAELRNPSLKKELQALSPKADSKWVARAVRGVDHLSARQRRNINRQLGLDSLGVSLALR